MAGIFSKRILQPYLVMKSSSFNTWFQIHQCTQKWTLVFVRFFRTRTANKSLPSTTIAFNKQEFIPNACHGMSRQRYFKRCCICLKELYL